LPLSIPLVFHGIACNILGASDRTIITYFRGAAETLLTKAYSTQINPKFSPPSVKIEEIYFPLLGAILSVVLIQVLQEEKQYGRILGTCISTSVFGIAIMAFYIR